jgi:hypothetical protein
MLLMRSVAILILIYSNISDDTRLERSLNDSENFLLNIMLCLRDDRFRQFYTAVCHNDSDCSVCHLSHISLPRLGLSSLLVGIVWVDVGFQFENPHRAGLSFSGGERFGVGFTVGF